MNMTYGKNDSSFHLWEGINLVTFTEERRITNVRMKKEAFKIQCSNLEPTVSREESCEETSECQIIGCSGKLMASLFNQISCSSKFVKNW